MSHFPTKAVRQKLYPKRQIAAMRDVTVLLVGLTPEDVERFHAAQVPYMGQRQDESAFITTTFDHLLAALTAMGWSNVEISEDQMHQKVVRRTVMQRKQAHHGEPCAACGQRHPAMADCGEPMTELCRHGQVRPTSPAPTMGTERLDEIERNVKNNIADVVTNAEMAFFVEAARRAERALAVLQDKNKSAHHAAIVASRILRGVR